MAVSRDGKSNRSGRGFSGVVRDYTRGMETDDIRRLVDRDARQAYSVLMRDRQRPSQGKGKIRDFLRDARLLFFSISEKLTPRRRLVFVISLLCAALGVFGGLDLHFRSPEFSFDFDASPAAYLLAIFGLLFLLSVELVDRILVRDEVEVARQLQLELLPKSTPEIPGWAFASSWRTANDIGGDYHRFEPVGADRLAILVADASGHGMAAGLLMAISDTSLRIALDLDPEPRAVAALLHSALRRTGDRRAFVTLFYGLLDLSSGRIDYVSAGHPSPLIRRSSGALDEPVAGSLPLGLGDSLRPVTGSFVLEPGELLFVVTDGVFEAVDTAGQAFSWEQLRRHAAAPAAGARAAHDRLCAAVDHHVADEPVSDDRTLVVVERLAADPPTSTAAS